MEDTKIINQKERNIVNILKDKAENPKASTETGLVNANTGSSMRLDSDGNVNLVSSDTVQYKLQYATGHATEISMESNTITNRKNILADELVFNKHKLNSQLYELTDMKQFLNDETKAIGNLTMYGTVLVKAYEPYLKKWVVIRRKLRTPIFSNMLNIPIAPKDMGLDDNISDEITEMRERNKISFDTATSNND